MKNVRRRIVLWMLMALFAIPVSSTVIRPVQVKAATSYTGWKVEGGNTYYYKKGVKQTGWLNLNGKRYYLNPAADGKMVTGRKTVGKYYYSFDKSGAMRKSMWVKDTKGNRYYFQANGRGIKSSWFQYKGQYFWFQSNYRMATGLKKIGNSTYYLNPKTTKEDGVSYRIGCRRSGWINLSGKRYYFKADGTMQTGLLKLSGEKYHFGKNGVMTLGWYTSVNGNKFYFKSPSGVMAVNTTLRISGDTWQFDKRGWATKVPYVIGSNGRVEVWDNGKKYYLEKEFTTHPGVADEKLGDDELLAAVLYCEAGDQGLAGMTAVALCIMNRVESTDPYYPNTLRYVIYQTGQYAVVKNGSLLRRLKTPNGEEAANCKKAVENAKRIMANHKANGSNRRITGITVNTMNGKSDFDCLYFMMRSSFASLGLDWDKCEAFQYKDHVFFSKWVY